MKYPIVAVNTKDSIRLFGFLAETKKKDYLFLHVHGTASSFYVEEFEQACIESLLDIEVASLFTNNRGNYVLESWQKTGAALERFEDCILDIDAWIRHAKKLGYKKIILSGHSLGTEKVVYYMRYGSYVDDVAAVILLGFSDSYGVQKLYEKTISVDLKKEAKKLVKQGKGNQFLTSVWLSHAGVLPQSAESYLNFFSDDSELSKALPLRKGKNLDFFSTIQVPILCVMGAFDAWAKPYGAEKLLSLMKRENKHTYVYLIKQSDHSFTGKQEYLASVIQSFIIKKIK